MNKRLEKERDERQRFSLRKLSVGLASVLVGVSFMAINAGQTVHADELQTPSQPNSAVQKANNVADDTVNANEQNQAKSNTAQAVDHANSNNNQQQNADKNTEAKATDKNTEAKATNAIVKQKDNATIENNENAGATAKDDANKVPENVNAPQNVIANQKRQTTVAFSVEKDNKPITANMLSENKVADVQEGSAGINKGVDSVKFAANGGFDSSWGKLDVNDWKGSVQGDYYQLSDYTGDANHIIVPNEADFAKAGISTSGKQVGVTSDLMHTIFRDKTTVLYVTVAFSKTGNKQVKAINASWHNTWGHMYAYSSAKQLSRFDGTNLDVSNVTDMNHMFSGNQISDLSSLSNWKVDNVTDMNGMFYNNHRVSNLSPLANWKVDNVTDMGGMFGDNQISNLNPLAKWNVNNVTNMGQMFEDNQISDLSPLANWKIKVANVTKMNSMFSVNQISNLNPLADWNIDKVTDMSCMFDLNKITDLSPLANWKVGQITNMSYMFDKNQISNLSPLANWKVDNVTDMGGMFSDNQISDLSPLANWKVDNVTDMRGMFSYNQISDLSPLTNWKVDNVTDIDYMFSDNQVSNLSPLANWKVDNVTDMRGMFENNQISDLSPLTNWKVDNVTDMDEMFENNQISDISPLKNWNTDNLEYWEGIFDYNSSIQIKTSPAKRIINFIYPDGYIGKKQGSITQTVDVPTQKVRVDINRDYNMDPATPMKNISNWVTKTETPISKITDPVYFQDYTVPEIKGLLEPDKTVISKQQADITKPINVIVTYKLAESNTNDAFALDPKNGLHEHANVNDNGGYDADFWGKININNWNYMVNGDTIEINGLKDGVSTGANDAVIVPNLDDFKLVGKDGGAKAVYISKDELNKTANHKYYGLSKTNGNKFATDSDISNACSNSNLTHADLNSLNTSKVTDMDRMFKNDRSLTSLDVSNWKTSNVTNMSIMFSETSSLTSLDVSNWDTSNVTDMRHMFDGASSLKSLDVSNWDTSKVTYMGGMFSRASGLTNLDVSNWDTSSVTYMSSMFYDASNLNNLDVSNWDTSKVTSMSNMFSNASSLTSLDVSNWDTGNVIDMNTMFGCASSLTSLDVSKWNTSNVTNMDSMFSGANNLTLIANNPSGWQATNYNTFARVPVIITNNANILNATDDGHYTIDGNSIARSVIFDSANSALQLPVYKGYANYTSDADRLKYAADVIKVYNEKVMKDYNKMHSDRTINYADDQDMNDPIALARAKFVTVAKQEDIQDNQANHDKLHATATREYIIHNIDGSTTTITQSINYHRTGKHNMVTNEDTFTEWIYSLDKNSVVVVVTKDKNGKTIANPVTVEGNNCVERNGQAYFGSIKIKPKAGFKLVLDKPATAKLNLQAKLASRLLPRQFFVLKAFAPMPHKMTKQVASANSIKNKQDHTSAPIEPITSANAIKQGKDAIVKPVAKTIEPNKQTNIHDQTHAGSPMNGLANTEPQLADVPNISMANSKQAKPDFNNQGSMPVANSSAKNSQKSVADKSRLQHPVTRTNDKVKPTKIATKSSDSRQNQNKKVLAKKVSVKPATNISTKAEKVTVKPAVNIPAKTAQPATQKIAAIAEKQTNAKHSLPQTSSANNLGATVIGLIMSGLGIALAGIRRHE